MTVRTAPLGATNRRFARARKFWSCKRPKSQPWRLAVYKPKRPR